MHHYYQLNPLKQNTKINGYKNWKLVLNFAEFIFPHKWCYFLFPEQQQREVILSPTSSTLPTLPRPEIVFSSKNLISTLPSLHFQLHYHIVLDTTEKHHGVIFLPESNEVASQGLSEPTNSLNLWKYGRAPRLTHTFRQIHSSKYKKYIPISFPDIQIFRKYYENGIFPWNEPKDNSNQGQCECKRGKGAFPFPVTSMGPLSKSCPEREKQVSTFFIPPPPNLRCAFLKEYI